MARSLIASTTPGWSDADITEVAARLTAEYAEAQAKNEHSIDTEDWNLLMELALSQAGS